MPVCKFLVFNKKPFSLQVPVLWHQFSGKNLRKSPVLLKHPIGAERHFHCWHTWHPQWGEAKNRWDSGMGRGVYYLSRNIQPLQGVYFWYRSIHSWKGTGTDDVLLRGSLPFGVPTHQFNWPFAESRCLSRVQSSFCTKLNSLCPVQCLSFADSGRKDLLHLAFWSKFCP